MTFAANLASFVSASNLNSSGALTGNITAPIHNSTTTLSLQTGGNTAVYIDTNQYVNIGTLTNSGSWKLNVNGAGHFGTESGEANDGETLMLSTTANTRVVLNTASSGTSKRTYIDNNTDGSLILNLDAGSNGSAPAFIVKRWTTEWMRINASGVMTVPNQVSFSAVKNGSQVNFPSSGTVVVGGWTTFHNVGSAFNATSGRFTAPTAGTYFLIFSFMVYTQSGTTDNQSRWYKNGSYMVGSNHVFSANENQVTIPIIVQLAAGDYMEPVIYCNTSGTSLIYSANYTHIHGWQLG